MKNFLRVLYFVYRNTIRSGRYSPRTLLEYLFLGTKLLEGRSYGKTTQVQHRKVSW
jgi:hypothetical protein